MFHLYQSVLDLVSGGNFLFDVTYFKRSNVYKLTIVRVKRVSTPTSFGVKGMN